MSRPSLTVQPLRPEDPVIRYAAEELARCLGVMTGGTVAVGEGGAIRLGLFADFPELREPPVRDPLWDDACAVVSETAGLRIAGSNPRSVLLGVYRYLRQLGAEWLWPGADGEYLPALAEVPVAGFDLRWRPPFRHRAGCIEGAVSLEHVLDYLEWMPRVGMSAFHLQFQHSGTFWRRWYEHQENPLWEERRELSDEECRALDAQVVAALRKRALLLHRVGHGWSAAALEFNPDRGWTVHEGPIPEGATALMAEVNGKRELWGGIAINTELCYSQPEARERFLGAVLDYAAAHPEVDALHVWLSDAYNNTCECESCRRLTPSDWYVTVLNELSPRLREINPAMRVVFLCYFNTLWPPREVRLDPECDNLTFMYAPITRCYQHGFGDPDCGEPLPAERPPLNQLTPPRGNRGNLGLLQGWLPFLPEDSFAFDYHFWMPWALDHTGFNLAAILPEDLDAYAALGIGGMMACGTERCFYPTAWPVHVMARRLSGDDYGEEAEARYLRLAFGEGEEKARKFLQGLEQRRARPEQGQRWWEAVTAEQARETSEWLERQADVLAEASRGAANPRERQAWALLRHFREFSALRWRAAQAAAAGERETALTAVGDAEAFLRQTEKDFHRWGDVWLLLGSLRSMREALT